jgi:purine nucleosidase
MRIFKIFFLLGIFALTISCSGKKTTDTALKDQKIPVILDTDANNELDDQHAIAYLLMNGDVFDVRGVTVNTTFGGGNIDEQYAEAERVMRLCDRFPGIPLFKGANGSFNEIRTQIDSNRFDGSDAVNFIIDQAKRYTPEHKLHLIMVGKLSNAALAFQKDSSIIPNIRLVWLGSNYPEPGEYNLENDTIAMNFVLQTKVEFEIVTVRYGLTTGTADVTISGDEIKTSMRGLGPHVKEAVMGRHNEAFNCFGDYSVNLFENAKLYGNPPSRALFDMAAVAIVKNPEWAQQKIVNRPLMDHNSWVEQKGNHGTIIIWENFNRKLIVDDFLRVMKNFVLADLSPEQSAK